MIDALQASPTRFSALDRQPTIKDNSTQAFNLNIRLRVQVEEVVERLSPAVCAFPNDWGQPFYNHSDFQ